MRRSRAPSRSVARALPCVRSFCSLFVAAMSVAPVEGTPHTALLACCFCRCITRKFRENRASKDAVFAEIDPRVPLERATHRTTGRAVRHMGRARACPLCSQMGRCLCRSMQKTPRACYKGRANGALFCVCIERHCRPRALCCPYTHVLSGANLPQAC